jgi:purine-binding chemotaxis protein CheW
VTAAIARRFASFFVGDLCFGIDVLNVQEVRAMTVLTRVPLAAGVVAGLLSLRGQIVTAIDLRRCLDLGDRPAGQPPVNVVLRTDDGCVSLLVDRIGEVLDVTEDDFERPPQTLRGPSRDVIRGAYKLDDRLLLALDLEKILMGLADRKTPVVFAEV